MPQSSARKAVTSQDVFNEPAVSLRLVKPLELRPAGWWRALPRALRPAHWLKNVLVLTPLITAHAYSDLGAVRSVLLLFVAWCLAASGVYVINDLLDVKADRQHPVKCRRPFASQQLSATTGIVMAIVLTLCGLGLAYSISFMAVLFVAIYMATSHAYSAYLKKIVLVDVFLLTSLYCLRVAGGSLITGHPLSIWLLAFSSFLFLSLSFLKRYAELARPRALGELQAKRRGYQSEDLLITAIFGIASGFMSAQVLLIYLTTDIARSEYRTPAVLCGVVPLLAFWICRLWLNAHRGVLLEDPLVYSARDRLSWGLAGLMAACFLIATKVTL